MYIFGPLGRGYVLSFLLMRCAKCWGGLDWIGWMDLGCVCSARSDCSVILRFRFFFLFFNFIGFGSMFGSFFFFFFFGLYFRIVLGFCLVFVFVLDF